jgi:hypothetical protein
MTAATSQQHKKIPESKKKQHKKIESKKLEILLLWHHNHFHQKQALQLQMMKKRTTYIR